MARIKCQGKILLQLLHFKRSINITFSDTCSQHVLLLTTAAMSAMFHLFLLELMSRLDMTTVYRLSGWAGHFSMGLNLVMSAVMRMPGKVRIVLYETSSGYRGGESRTSGMS